MNALLFKNFMRSKGTKAGLVFLLILCLISLMIGKQYQFKQQKNAVDAALYQKEHHARNVKFHPDEMGLLLYYIKFSLVNTALPINSLAIGQRDVNPSIQTVTIRGLEGQQYDSELNNPNTLLLGNIDLSFVLIYIFPLLIIAFTYNIISEEKESGTWKIVSIQSKNILLHILKLFYIRISTLLALYTAIVFMSTFYLNIPFNSTLLAYYGISLLYILFWFSCCFFIVSLQKNSNYNAVVLLTTWLFLIVVLPACINTYLVHKYPIPEALELTIKQRNAYHEKWDMDKQTTLDKFYNHYPQFKTYPLPTAEFSWLWYYAMQQMSDDESKQQSTHLMAKLTQRNIASQEIAQFIPTLHAQIRLNEIAQADLANQMHFWKATAGFHEKLRLYFYPKIFNNDPVNKEDWSTFKVEYYRDSSPIDFIKITLPLLLFSTILLLIGWYTFKLRKTAL